MFKVFRVLRNLRDLDENIHIIKKRFHYVVDLLEAIKTIVERILATMTTKADLEAINSQLVKAFGEIKGRIDELVTAHENNEDVSSQVAALKQTAQQLDDIVADAPSETPEAGEGQDTFPAPATPADEVAGQQG